MYSEYYSRNEANGIKESVVGNRNCISVLSLHCFALSHNARYFVSLDRSTCNRRKVGKTGHSDWSVHKCLLDLQDQGDVLRAPAISST